MRQGSTAVTGLEDNPLWYKDAVIYEIHIRAFNDSNGDGIGDFNGLIEKLDYLQDLGVTALWLLPFYPSPLKDGGYDIADYTAINPSYGTLDDFRRFLKEAHDRGLRVITELVLNHTSSDHAWFQRARRAEPGSRWRNFYVWSDTPQLYKDARIIFKDFETSNWSWDAVANAYYWHRFYSHQPDLNFDNSEVGETMLQTVDFWMDLGVDGLRLDAVPYLYEREGTNCENLDETHVFLKRLRAHVDAKYKNRMLLAEANQWPEDAAAYFGDGDECQMNFHFPLMPRMFMAVQLEDRFPIIDILRQTPNIPESCQWATFLRNHDELTLEMVTDEDRDYMYKVYAEDPNARINLGIRRRLAPLVKSRRKIELMNALLFSLPGTPVLYYGDEIGMGDNIYLGDRDGVRTPMQWSADRNAGFSRANPQRLYLPITTDPEYHYEAFNVQAQQSNLSSLLWWMKRIIDIRKNNPVFGRGTIEFLQPDNSKILVFLRTLGDARVLVVANLSHHPQFAEIDLSSATGLVPIEMFGRTAFPTIGDRPYFVTLPPHCFYWFSLEKAAAATAPLERPWETLPPLREYQDLFAGAARSALARQLVTYVSARRWFRSKARAHKSASIVDVVELSSTAQIPQKLLLLQIEFVEGEAEVYVVPLAVAMGDAAATLREKSPHTVIANVQIAGLDGVLHDALATGGAADALMEAVRAHSTLAGDEGRIVTAQLPAFAEVAGGDPLSASASELEQTNSTIAFGNRYLLKVYRQLEAGINPELEIGGFVARNGERSVSRLPRLIGSIVYQNERGPATLATVQEFVAHEGVAWPLTLSAVERYFERVLSATASEHPPEPASPTGSLVEQARQTPSPGMQALVGAYFGHARQMGQRVAEMHLLLASEEVDPAFAPEAFSGFHQRSIFQGAHSLLMRTTDLLRRRLGSFDHATRTSAEGVIALEAQIDHRLRAITSHKIDVVRIRVHGDLHLGQILHTGDDFVVIDFEGEPSRPINERRYKRNPLRDVTGMIRSFQYAAESVLRGGRFRVEDVPVLRTWAQCLTSWVTATFLAAYFERVGSTPFIPKTDADTNLLLGFYILEKSLYEVGYELNNRPDWLPIPLRGILDEMAVATPQP